MAYTIRAATCEHVLRKSQTPLKDLVGIETSLDYGQPLCAKCENAIHRELDQARERYKNFRGNRSLDDNPAYERIVNRLRAARVKLANYEEQKEEYSRTIQARSSSAINPAGRHIQFSAEQQHRDESLYRPFDQFDRTSQTYLPGLHADRSGDGYLDTSWKTTNWDDMPSIEWRANKDSKA